MGGGFVLLFWMILLGAFCAAWMATFGVYCLGRDKGSKALQLLGGVPLIVLTLIGIGVVGFVAYVWIRSSTPSFVYESCFHEPPTDDVTNLRSSYWSFADSKQVFLTFQAKPETFRRILPQNLRRMEFSDYRERMPLTGHQTPSWWRSPTETSEIYFADSTKGLSGTFYEETTLVTFEATTGTVMYFFVGID